MKQNNEIEKIIPFYYSILKPFFLLVQIKCHMYIPMILFNLKSITIHHWRFTETTMANVEIDPNWNCSYPLQISSATSIKLYSPMLYSTL